MSPWKNLIFENNEIIHLEDIGNQLSDIHPVEQINHWGLTSYTLRQNLYDYRYFLQGTRTNISLGSNIDQDISNNTGRGEYAILKIFATIHPSIDTIIRQTFNITDRGNNATLDPASNTKVNLSFLPKGITLFQPELIEDLNLSAEYRREILKANETDPTIPDTDKSIIIRAFHDGEKLNIYFNKRSKQSLRRLIYKTIVTACYYFDIENLLTSEEDKMVYTDILTYLTENLETDKGLLIEHINTYVNKKLLIIQDTLIDTFSATLQTTLNQQRKDSLTAAYDNATRDLAHNVEQYGHILQRVKQATKALADYSETDYTTIKDFLNKIKESPNTKHFNKQGAHSIDFIIEEPLIHTDGETWARYLANKSSEINQIINHIGVNRLLDSDLFENTGSNIIRFAIQRFIKELFVDQKIQMYTAVRLGMQNNTYQFTILKYPLNTKSYIPHPHIGSDTLTCWNEALRAITSAIMQDDDAELAYLQLTYAIQQMTASDSVVSKKLIKIILDDDYMYGYYYQRKDKSERENFITIIKEFIDDETNKINAIIDSES